MSLLVLIILVFFSFRKEIANYSRFTVESKEEFDFYFEFKN